MVRSRSKRKVRRRRDAALGEQRETHQLEAAARSPTAGSQK